MAEAAVSTWLTKFSTSLANKEFDAVAEMFEPGEEGVFWRDLVSFTWNIHTFEGQKAIRAALEATAGASTPEIGTWKIFKEASGTEADGFESHFTFETNVFRGRGYVRLKPSGKAWTFMTSAQELKGHEEKCGRHETRPHGVTPGKYGLPEAWSGGPVDEKVGTPALNWQERKEMESAELGKSAQPYVVIIGGGQGGIALGARCQMLGIPHVVLEKNERAGDSWRKRYRSLCLHDPVWYDHMPYIPFPDHWPVFSPKDMIGDWLEMYTRVMNITYWTKTNCEKATFDSSSSTWTVNIVRDGEAMVLRPSHLVFATGLSGFPNMPEFEGQKSFAGEIYHSSEFRSKENEFKGNNAIVIGSNNSAHDIASQLFASGANVTILQRSSTHIVTSDTLMNTMLAGLYDENATKNGIDTNTADLTFSGIPFKILPTIHQGAVTVQKQKDSALLNGLEKAGFLLDYGEDESGLFCKYLRRGSGYYIDVGASQLIVDGKVKVCSGKQIKRILQTGVELDDGSSLPADLIICATGYGNMNEWIKKIIDEETQLKVGMVWGLGSGTTKDPGPWEGELRNMWKPTTQQNLWFHGGNLHQSRQHSLFLALQLKARMEGLTTPVYPAPKTNHARGGYGK